MESLSISSFSFPWKYFMLQAGEECSQGRVIPSNIVLWWCLLHERNGVTFLLLSNSASIVQIDSIHPSIYEILCVDVDKILSILVAVSFDEFLRISVWNISRSWLGMSIEPAEPSPSLIGSKLARNILHSARVRLELGLSWTKQSRAWLVLLNI